MTALQGVTDPAAWGQAFGSLGPIGLLLVPLLFVLLFSFGFFGTIVLLWRGSDRLGIVGFGREIRDDFRRLVKILDRVAIHLGAETEDEPLEEPVDRPAASKRGGPPGQRVGRAAQLSRPR